jgi:hypothetical protein
VTFNGTAPASIAGSAANYVFVGPTSPVTITVAQRLTGTATAVLGMTSGTPQSFDIGLCYQLGAGTITNFAALNYITARAHPEPRQYSAAASVQPFAAGTYTVGLCVRNTGTGALNNNDWVNGWVAVTN